MSSPVSAINAQCRASDEIVRGQHHDRICNIFGIADPVYQVQACELTGVIDPMFGVQRRFDGAC